MRLQKICGCPARSIGERIFERRFGSYLPSRLWDHREL